MKQVLDEWSMTAFVKTSGSSGIHVFIPLKRGHTFEQALRWSEQVAGDVAARGPKVATVERSLAERTKSQVYVDWQQNARGKAIAAPYSVRPKPKATVSAPVTWEEVERGFELTDFTIRTMHARLDDVGDLWEGMRRHQQKLPAIG